MHNVNLIAVFLLGLPFLFAGTSQASPAKFNIPGDFPGSFQIDFLGTDFKLGGNSTGSLSTASTINFYIGTETSLASGIYNTSVAPEGFNFVGFSPLIGLTFDVYGAGTGTGTFDTSTGNWVLDMPTLFVNHYGNNSGDATRVDIHLTTSNIWIPAGSFDDPPGYTTTTASPMVLDVNSPQPWGDMHLVAGGLAPNSSNLTLTYDWTLINAISTNYTNWAIDQNSFAGVQYEFNIYGNDPRVSISYVPVPAAVWLFGSGLLGIIGVARRKAAA